MTDLATPEAARPSFLDSLGDRAARRAEPRATIALAGAGCFLAVGGALVVAGDAGLPDGSGSFDFNRLPGIALGALLVLAGLLTLQQRSKGPLATAGAVATALGIPVLVGFLLVGGHDGRIDAVFGVATLAWTAAYLLGPTKGRPAFLGLALYGAWSTAMQVVGSGLSFGLALTPVGLFGSGQACYSDSVTGVSRCDPSGFGSTGGLGSGSGFGSDFATVGALSIGIGVAYLLLSRHFDRTGRRGMSTPFVAVGLLAFVEGVGYLAIDLHLRAGGGLVIVAGLGLALFGGLVGRRFTTWLGAFGALVGTALVLLPDVDSATSAGFVLIAGGLAIVAVAHVLAVRLDEPDEMGGPGTPEPSRHRLTTAATTPDAGFAEAPLLELVPLAPTPPRPAPATRAATAPTASPAKRVAPKRVAPVTKAPVAKQATVAKKAAGAKKAVPKKAAGAKKAPAKRPPKPSR